MTPNELIQVINKALKLDITTKSRKREVVYARFIFYNKLRNSKEKYYSFQNIGDYLEKDHATIIHGLKQYDILKEYDDFKEILNKVETEIERSGGYATNKLERLFTNHFEIRKYNETSTNKIQHSQNIN